MWAPELWAIIGKQLRYRERGVLYYPYVEPKPGAGSGLLETLSKRACAVVSDDFPCFFLPRMVSAVAQRLPVRLELIDGNGILPLRAAPQVFSTASRREGDPEIRKRKYDLIEKLPLTK